MYSRSDPGGHGVRNGKTRPLGFHEPQKMLCLLSWCAGAIKFTVMYAVVLGIPSTFFALTACGLGRNVLAAWRVTPGAKQLSVIHVCRRLFLCAKTRAFLTCSLWNSSPAILSAIHRHSFWVLQGLMLVQVHWVIQEAVKFSNLGFSGKQSEIPMRPIARCYQVHDTVLLPSFAVIGPSSVIGSASFRTSLSLLKKNKGHGRDFNSTFFFYAM